VYEPLDECEAEENVMQDVLGRVRLHQNSVQAEDQPTPAEPVPKETS
jgi:hypothetical protein